MDRADGVGQIVEHFVKDDDVECPIGLVGGGIVCFEAGGLVRALLCFVDRRG